jgi:hypothetical protein
MVTSAMPFHSTLSAGPEASVLVSTTRSMRSMVAGDSAAPRRRRYCAPATSASRPSQNRLARNTLVTTGVLWTWLATWPRSIKMSSSSVMPTDWPTPAFAGAGAFQLSIEATRALALIGENSSVSPTCRLPLSMRPAMMRRWSNLYTSCTVRRSGRSVAAMGCGTASSACSSVGPSYQDIAPRLRRFSPSRAASGTNVMSSASTPIERRYAATSRRTS